MPDEIIYRRILDHLSKQDAPPKYGTVSAAQIGLEGADKAVQKALVALWEAGWIGGNRDRTALGETVGSARLTELGRTAVAEGRPLPGVSPSVHNDNRQFSIGTNHGAVQQGDGNTQNVSVHLQALIEAVKASDMSEDEKRGALDYLKGFATSPGVANGLQLGSLVAQLFGGS